MNKISNERKAQIFYQGNGTQTQYSFPFDYLRKAFVHVSLISDEKVEELTQGTDYTVTDRVVTLAAPTGLKIKIYRQTATKPLVGWADASVLKAADMTVQSTQLLHLAEETSDLAQDGGLSKDGTDNIWDARYNKIKNLLDPTDPGDAVTLRYITKNQDSLLNQLKNTGAAQNSSIVSTGDAQNARLTSTGDTQNTRLNTTGDTQDKRLNDLGQRYVDLMTTLKDTATTKATEATNSAELSKKWAMSDTSPDGVTGNKSSKTWAGEAKTSASNANASASSSQSSANASSAYATQSANSASASKSSAIASASSASAASSSASAASTSATNAKTSETNAANSAKAAKASADRAATFDPTSYYTKAETYTRAEVDNKISNIDLSQYATTTYVRTEISSARASIEATIPTKTSQLTNDSGFADAASLEEEAKKWKAAYNTLRKRSTPAVFDAAELTLLMNTPISRGNITLLHPYTDFDGLLIEYTNDDGDALARQYISSTEIQDRIARAIGLKGQRATIALVTSAIYWNIWVDESKGFSTTTFPEYADNGTIQRIYGVKFKEIT